MIKNNLLLVLLLLPFVLFGQEDRNDSLIQLEETMVTGYLSTQPLLQTPTSVGIVTPEMLRKRGGESLLPVLNSLPGIRMEQRSPGSYRLSIRGSLLRSPWGVRNVKVYMDEFPLTDAGGNTYLNLIDTRIMNRLEILKGPDGSLFGANSGGVVLIDPFSRAAAPELEFGITGGAYDLIHQNSAIKKAGKKSKFELEQAYFSSNGYREHSAMQRHYLQASEQWKYSEKSELKLFAFFADHEYKTPGGLNQQQYLENPRQARPAAGPNPGAVEQDAGIRNKTFFGGVGHETAFTKDLRHVISVFGSDTRFENPFITNYEERDELNYGTRTYLELKSRENEGAPDWKLNLGLEWQQSEHEIVNYDNLGNSTKGELQAADDFRTTSHFYFASFHSYLTQRLNAEAAVSLNFYNYDFRALAPIPSSGSSNFAPEWMPRFGLSYLVDPDLALRASISRGYSPPTTSEIRPSGLLINTALDPETGWNFEAGTRISKWNRRLQSDLSVYYYKMKDAIVRRTGEGGEEFFINAGGTEQVGLESMFSYWIKENSQQDFLRSLKLLNSYSLSLFKFREYVQGNEDHSGNWLTGVPRHVLVTNLDAELPWAMELSVQHNFTDQIPLNDANSVHARSYHLLGAKLGWSHLLNRNTEVTFYAGADNILNEKYSLGNDINAFGNRFFNAAPERNFYVGMKVGLGR